MDEAKIKNLALELAKGLKSHEDLNQISSIFKKVIIRLEEGVSASRIAAVASALAAQS